VEERTERGRAFHVDAAADWKDRLPMVKRVVHSGILLNANWFFRATAVFPDTLYIAAFVFACFCSSCGCKLNV